MRSITLRELARKARVSPATASRILNGDPSVRQSSRERVLALAKALDYQPNLLAKGLRAGRTHTLALIVDNVANPFFADVTLGIEDRVHECGYSLFLCNTNQDSKRALDYLDALSARGVDGVIYASTLDVEQVAARLDRLRREGVRLVLLGNLGRRLHTLEVPSVSVDERTGVALAVRHLVELGHRAIGFVQGRAASVINQERFAGYVGALAEAGCTCRPEWCPEGHYRLGPAQEAVGALLARSPRPTALIAANDLMALGAYRAVRENGLRVPEDLSVVGFDDVDFAQDLSPPLTTVHVDRRVLGDTAARALLAAIDGGGGGEVPRVMLTPRLMVRGSATACRTPAVEVS